jgi:hypothetical protein
MQTAPAKPSAAPMGTPSSSMAMKAANSSVAIMRAVPGG